MKFMKYMKIEINLKMFNYVKNLIISHGMD